jgi:hypothetical protein
MKVSARNPVGVSIALHYHLTVWYSPHFPLLIVTCCHCYELSRVYCDALKFDFIKSLNSAVNFFFKFIFKIVFKFRCFVQFKKKIFRLRIKFLKKF